ncbi:BTAD domain-containing putative transcriptional regulator [Amycolatopsis sp. NPDC048633]|uniref:BTAD domain-containing putative transcriptional regulator n=1 Tax=Amycolatopsis sp. NPDC048633 TaxID=3157095 RepID=UPI0033D45E65
MTLGERLLAYRQRTGISQQDLAESAGVSVRTLRDIERGEVRRPHARSLAKLLAATGLESTGIAAPAEQAGGFRVEVLGPLTVRRDGREVPLGSVMQARLLGLLTLRANRVVSRADVVEFLWGEDSPDSSVNLVQTYVSRLRKFFAGLDADPGVVTRVGPGYRLGLTSGQCDLLEFAEALSQAQEDRRAGDPAAAVRSYRSALELWRGQILDGVPLPAAPHPVVVAVTQQRLKTVLDYADLALPLGHHDAVLDRLREAAFADPLHEGLTERIMRALAASGQRAAAVKVFIAFRGRLRENLGLEPGPELQRTYLHSIREEPGTPTPALLSRRTGGPAAPTPAELPPDPSRFIGRDAQLRQLDEFVFDAAPHASARVVVLSGTAGVGKSALAVRWAHRMRHRFPDGQLHAGLNGFSAVGTRSADDVVAGFLTSLGVAPATIPADLDARVALFRSVLADRRMLLVLDDAVSPDHVRPLIAASPHCAVLVTSRNSLAALTLHVDALLVELDVISRGEAVALLRASCEREAAEASLADLEELARLCAHLPLALRIAAANIAGRKTVAEYLTVLTEGDRLAGLAMGGDSRSAVQTAFEMSYAALAPETARLFRLLGSLPGPDAGMPAIAALAGVGVDDAARMVDRLVAAHLVQRRPGGRFQTHDLLRLFAGQRSARTDDEADRTAALERLFDYYLETATQATATLYPGMLRLSELRQYPPAPWRERDEPGVWLAAERAGFAAVVAHAAEHGPQAVAWQLIDVLRGHLWRTYDPSSWCTLALAGLDAARREGNRAAEAAMHYSLGAAHRYGLRDLAASRQHLDQAQRMLRDLGDTTGCAAALDSLGMVLHEAGESGPGLAALETSLELCREAGFVVGQAKVLGNVGLVLATMGRTEEARQRLAEAAAFAARLGDRHLEATVQHNLGYARACDGRFIEAERSYQQALLIREDIGDAEGRASTLEKIGTLLHDTGNPAHGTRYWEAALVVFDEIAHPKAAEVRARLGQY